MQMRPFWRYYGGKWRAAPRYPKPSHATIVEPFAGAAGYALRYPHHQVILVEKYAVLAEVWRYLIGASANEVRAIPCVDSVHDLPSGTPQGAVWLVGFCLQDTAKRPCHNLSSGMSGDAKWLPFAPMYNVSTMFNENKSASVEAVWLNERQV